MLALGFALNLGRVLSLPEPMVLGLAWLKDIVRGIVREHSKTITRDNKEKKTGPDTRPELEA